jgi:chitosanase
MLTDVQERTAKAIVNLFETSQVLGDYAKVTLIPGDTGQLTYGRSQTTLASGGLHGLIGAYTGAAGALFSNDLAPFVAALEVKDPTLNADRYFHNLLRAAADDPVMRASQDRFFDETYWRPALRAASRDGIASALGIAVVYDSWVHGSWGTIRARTSNAAGLVGDVGERAWIAAYVHERHTWLSGHRRADLRRTVYRMEALLDLVQNGDWTLPLPMIVRGQAIDEAVLTGPPPGVFDGPRPRSRSLRLTQPITRGLDVRLAQVALSRPGHDLEVAADGLFGRRSERAVSDFQERVGLPPTGAVDEATFDRLL